MITPHVYGGRREQCAYKLYIRHCLCVLPLFADYRNHFAHKIHAYRPLLQIYNRDARDTLYANYAGFLDKKQFFHLMDQLVARETLEGNCASNPRKRVRVMVVADYEDTIEPAEKLFWWVPVHTDALPAFRLCAPEYWQEGGADALESEGARGAGPRPVLRDPVDALDELCAAGVATQV